TTAADAGDAFLMNQGYSLAWNGWDISAPPATLLNNNLNITVPMATYPDGSTITGPSYEYLVCDNATTVSGTLAYPAASLDKSEARLTVKQHLRDTPVEIPAGGWDYTSTAGTAIKLTSGAFQQSAIYEFTYMAKNPLVAGLGFAATRDFISFLRHARADDYGNPNPLARHVKHTLTFSISQPARYLNDYETLGFNEDERGRRVIDGILNWIGGGSGIGMHVRFAQPGRTERNRQNHRYPEANFPFTYEPDRGVLDAAGRRHYARAGRGRLRAASGAWFPKYPRRHVLRRDHTALQVRLRAALRRRHHGREPARLLGPRLPVVRLQSRRR